MIRYLLAFLLLAHGLIHLMGFFKAYKLAEIPQLNAPISKPVGMLWLAAAVLFVLSGVLFFLKKDAWWMPATAAVLLSQMLIFSAWQEARFGTAANLIIIVAIVFGYGIWHFNAMVKSELSSFLPQQLPSASTLTSEKIAELPTVVQQWLLRSNAVDRPITNTLHLDQNGAMRSTPDGKWMPVQAEQFFTVEHPGFYWMADVTMMPGVHLAGRDKYQEGHGHMLIKAFSLFPVADSKGPETDQGSMLRYLAETCWFPSAAVREYIRWEQLDSVSAKATMRYGGVEASGTFHFTEEGDLKSFDALRYYDRKGGATLEKWHIENDLTSFRDFEGIRIPTKSEVSWQLAGGDFTWYRLEITNVQYNVQQN